MTGVQTCALPICFPVTIEFELTLGEDLRKKFDDMKEADAEWERLKKGPMGTVLTDEENEESNGQTN